LSPQAGYLSNEFDSELKEKLRLQGEAHTSQLSDALRDQASQLGALWSKELETKLVEQEWQYQAEISMAMAKLRGIESMVNTVANAGQKSIVHPKLMYYEWVGIFVKIGQFLRLTVTQVWNVI